MDFLCTQDRTLVCVECLTKGVHNSHQAVAVPHSMKKLISKKEKKSDEDSGCSPIQRFLTQSLTIPAVKNLHISPCHSPMLNVKNDFPSSPNKPPFLRSHSDDLLLSPLRRKSKEQGIGLPTKIQRTESKFTTEHSLNIEAKFLSTSTPVQAEEKLSVESFWENIGTNEVDWTVLEKEIIKHFNQHALKYAKSYRSLSKDDLTAIRTQLEEGKRFGKISYTAVKKRWHWFITLERIVQKIGYVWWQEEPRLCQGIVSRTTSEHLLQGQPKGTFILRFSESQAGFIAVDYVHSRRGVVHTLIDANGSRFKSFERVHDKNVEREHDTLPELIMSLSFFSLCLSKH